MNLKKMKFEILLVSINIPIFCALGKNVIWETQYKSCQTHTKPAAISVKHVPNTDSRTDTLHYPRMKTKTLPTLVQ